LGKGQSAANCRPVTFHSHDSGSFNAFTLRTKGLFATRHQQNLAMMIVIQDE
jgi:hypothetical protein